MPSFRAGDLGRVLVLVAYLDQLGQRTGITRDTADL
jgi:hypothetical protein